MDDMHPVDNRGAAGQAPHDPVDAGMPHAVVEGPAARAPHRRTPFVENATAMRALAPDLEGHRNKYIAEYFSLSVKTVEKHRSNLMQKLDLHNSSMLTSYAIAHGLIEN
jgi:hypothetical protein